MAELESRGVGRDNILAVPLELRPVRRAMFDTIHRSDGSSYLDIGMAAAAACSVITAAIGFKLLWGPIYWGLIGAAGGFTVGLIIELLLHRKRKKSYKRKRMSEMFVLVRCSYDMAEMIADILWKNRAFGVAVISDKRS